MPLTIVRSDSNAELWRRCRDGFLSEIGETPGPNGFASHLWLAHRGARDALFEAAAERGLPGWLSPPVSFFSELPLRFGIRQRPIGHLTGRLLVSRIAAHNFRQAGLGSGRTDRGPAGSHAIDALFSELLPEGVSPSELEAAVSGLGGDDFAIRRNRWVVESYAEFLGELERLDRFDPRSIHAILARRVLDGGLPAAIGGARRLHVYGPTSLKGRRALFRALASQEDVEVVLYLTAEPGTSEWQELGADVEELLLERSVSPEIERVLYEAPDARAETRWIAERVKRLLMSDAARPHEIAVIARSGGEDTRRIVDALEEAGVPSTSRARHTLADIAALRALLILFRGAANDWDYGSLRQLLASPFFRAGIDLRPVDFLAGERRIRGLDQWTEGLKALVAAAADDRMSGRLARAGMNTVHLAEDLASFESLAAQIGPLSDGRTEREWIDLSLEILDGRRFGFRRRLSEVPAGRYDLVRVDQRGVEVLRELLGEWRELRKTEDALGPAEWFDRLRRLLASNEIALTTPESRGVQVLEAHEAALGAYRRVFLVRANDGVFPQPWTTRGVFSEPEILRLKDHGLPLTTRDDALRREIALWTAVTSVDSVTFSCRSTSSEGHPLTPSLLIPADVVPWSAGGSVDADRAREGGGIDRVSRALQLESEADQLGRAVRSAGIDSFASVDPEALRHAILTAWSEELRSGRLEDGATQPECARPSMRPHPWGGLIRDPAVLRVLADRFGDSHTWSASQLEQYGRRPFDYLVDRVLGLRVSDEAEDTTSPASRGALAHTILERFFRALGEARPTELSGDALDLYREVARVALDEAEAAEDHWLGEPALWRVTREQIVESVRAFLERELPRLDKEGAWPIEFELGFGDEDGDRFELEGEDLQGLRRRMRVRGRIDRLDARLGKDGPELRVLDYKWGGYPSASGYRDGSVLQTAIYLRAASVISAVDGALKWGAYRPITKTTASGARLSMEEVDGVLAFALSIPERVRNGWFEPVLAASQSLGAWQVGPEVTRTSAQFRGGHRFEIPPGGPSDV
ncbi:MAG: PD-(D/E)XK nuclease family protein [marine benthic group bacterium]|nr:PD-(D/E)XK nuclease family protein [Gemmatimonadota bacterium]